MYVICICYMCCVIFSSAHYLLLLSRAIIYRSSTRLTLKRVVLYNCRQIKVWTTPVDFLRDQFLKLCVAVMNVRMFILNVLFKLRLHSDELVILAFKLFYWAASFCFTLMGCLEKLTCIGAEQIFLPPDENQFVKLPTCIQQFVKFLLVQVLQLYHYTM